MNGIVININPVALEIGSFGLRWYSLAIMLAVVAAVVIASRGAKARGLPPDEIYSLLPWVLIGGIVGAAGSSANLSEPSNLGVDWALCPSKMDHETLWSFRGSSAFTT